MTSENIYIWNHGMKSSFDDSLLKPFDLIRFERRRHLEFAAASQGFVQPMAVMMWTGLRRNAARERLGNDEILCRRDRRMKY